MIDNLLKILDGSGAAAMPEALQIVVDDLYLLRAEIEGCAANAADKTSADRQRKNLSMTAAFCAKTPSPSSVELRRDLSRRLKMIATGRSMSSGSFSRSLDGCELNDVSLWSAAERTALKAFWTIFFDRIRPSDTISLDDAICLFVRGGVSAAELFAHIEAWPISRLVNHLWHDWCGIRPYEIVVGDGWKDPDLAYSLYASDGLYERLVDYAVDPETVQMDADRALALASIIDSSDYFNRMEAAEVTVQ